MLSKDVRKVVKALAENIKTASETVEQEPAA